MEVVSNLGSLKHKLSTDRYGVIVFPFIFKNFRVRFCSKYRWRVENSV